MFSILEIFLCVLEKTVYSSCVGNVLYMSIKEIKNQKNEKFIGKWEEEDGVEKKKRGIPLYDAM